MQSRKILIALSFLYLAVLTSISTAADTTFTTSRFSISFPPAWQKVPFMAGGDSLLAVFNDTNMAYCYMTASTTDHPLTAQELEAYRKAYAGSDSVNKVADGTKTLGGKSFSFVEYQSTVTANDSSRVRIYYTNVGSNLFTSILIYTPGSEDGAVADLESALATLSLSASPIHAWIERPTSAGRAAIHDVLGRSRPLAARTALYRLPLP